MRCEVLDAEKQKEVRIVEPPPPTTVAPSQSDVHATTLAPSQSIVPAKRVAPEPTPHPSKKWSKKKSALAPSGSREKKKVEMPEIVTTNILMRETCQHIGGPLQILRLTMVRFFFPQT